MELNISVYVGGILKGAKKINTPCLIGRSKEAGLTVAHPAMSRKHCELFEEGGKLFLRDNSSLNGTLYHGEYVEVPVEFPVGSEFSVGELTFKISAVPTGGQEHTGMVDRPTQAIDLGDKESKPETESEENQAGMVTIIDHSSAGQFQETVEMDQDAMIVQEKPSVISKPEIVEVPVVQESQPVDKVPVVETPVAQKTLAEPIVSAMPGKPDSPSADIPQETSEPKKTPSAPTGNPTGLPKIGPPPKKIVISKPTPKEKEGDKDKSSVVIDGGAAASKKVSAKDVQIKFD